MNYHVFHDSFTGDIDIRESSICSPKSLYKKTSQEILGELKAAFKTASTNLLGVCQQPALTHTAVTTKRKGEEERNKTIVAISE